MDTKMSLTVKGIVVMLLGFVLSKVDMPLEETKLTSFIETGLVIVGAIVAYIGRVRAGDLTWYGTRKTL